jgi:hypothetical protein
MAPLLRTNHVTLCNLKWRQVAGSLGSEALEATTQHLKSQTAITRGIWDARSPHYLRHGARRGYHVPVGGHELSAALHRQ